MDNNSPTNSIRGSNINMFSSHQTLPCIDDDSGGNNGSTRFQVEPLELPSPTDVHEILRPRVKFKMSASNESIDKLAPAKSPILKSALKPFPPHTYHAGDGRKKLLDVNIDNVIPFRSHENVLEKKNSKSMFPENAVVQLYHFDAEHEGGMWHEAARFIKYEQTVEGVDTMWSKPHVPFLTYKSVSALRDLLESDQAMCALEIQGEKFGEICHHAAFELEKLGAMNSEDSNALVSFMTFRRDHAKNNESSFNWIRKLTASGINNASMIFQREPPSRCVSTSAIDMPNKFSNDFYSRAYGSFGHNVDDLKLSTDVIYESQDSPLDSSQKLPCILLPDNEPLLLDVPKPPVPSNSAHSLHSMKSNVSGVSSQWEDHHIPDGAECVQVLVGRTGIFDETKFILIRLQKPLLDFHLTKKRIPIRFIVLIVGPVEANNTFLEMGRVFSSLAINKDFLSTLYSLEDKSEMVRSFDQYMNSMFFIPPMEVDSPELLSFEALGKVVKRNEPHLRRRKSKRAQKKLSLNRIAEERDTFDSNSSNENILKECRSAKDKDVKIFSGLIADFKNVKRRYLSDFHDIAKGKMMAFITIISLYLCLIPPTITFAKILEEFTGGGMGVSESLISTCLIGIIWALFSAQPLFIQSVTGPVIIFEGSFYKLSQLGDLDYMEVRVYAGITLFFLCLITVAFNGTRLLKYITGFTEEIFSCLIALIYIMETGHYIYHEYESNPSEAFHFYKNFTNPCLDELLENGGEITADTAFECDLPRPNAGVMAACVVFISFSIAMVLYYVKFSAFLGRCVRNFLADFNILITLVFTVGIIYILVPRGVLRTVNIPTVLRWTNRAARNHDIVVTPDLDPLHMAKYSLAGIGGGLMIYVLLVAETSMCSIMLQQKERKLVKPSGLNWDLMVMAVGVLVTSLLGLPWMCVAGVQTISHCKGLSFMKKTAPGETPQVDWIVEQRVTTFCVAILIGMTTFLGKFLNYIPVPCLFGVFLYSGMTSMMEASMFEGLLNVMHFGKHFRHTDSDMNVTSTRIRIYRFLQLISLIIIYTVKQIKAIAIMFPFVIVLLIIGRQLLLPLIYSDEELNALDPEDDEGSDTISSCSDSEKRLISAL